MSNAELTPALTRRFCRLDPEAETLLGLSVRKLALSARGCDRVLRVARTIADLEDCGSVRAEHLAEALHYRHPGAT